MSNVLGDTTRHPILALGRLGWTLSRIQQRRTPGNDQRLLESRGDARAWSRAPERTEGKTANFPAGGVHRLCSGETGHFHRLGVHRLRRRKTGETKPATRAEVPTDSAPIPRPSRAPSASACEPYRELIIEAVQRGRNGMAIWQDLVDDHGLTARYLTLEQVDPSFGS